jgi:inner membrane protein
LLGYSMSGVIDACTSYGTHLFWPFSDERIAWHIISIIDPIFTLILLVTFILGLRIKRRQVAFIGLALSATYMGLGIIQFQRASTIADTLAMTRGHTTIKHVVKPTLANLLLWRSTYIVDGRIYVDAIRAGLFGSKIFEGESVELFNLQKDLPDLDQTTALYDDIQRFIKFSDGYVAFDPTQPDVLGDIRYSMLPTSTKPLWGIILNKEQPHTHTEYRFFRDNSKDTRQTFMKMLFN